MVKQWAKQEHKQQQQDNKSTTLQNCCRTPLKRETNSSVTLTFPADAELEECRTLAVDVDATVYEALRVSPGRPHDDVVPISTSLLDTGNSGASAACVS